MTKLPWLGVLLSLLLLIPVRQSAIVPLFGS